MSTVRFVAEVSSNHHADLDRCLAFVDRAAAIGCDGVKFQLFRLCELFAPEVLARRPDLRAREAWELPVEFLAPLAARAWQRGIEFACTPFYLDAVAELAHYVGFFKIASYELIWDDLLRACAATGRPIVLSTGMATRREIDHAMSVLTQAGCRDLTLLGCVSGYPTPARSANLASIRSLRTLASRRPALRLRVGWSDHTVEPAVIYRAVHHFGAKLVEFHLDLDGHGEEYASGHCWLPDAISEVIRNVRVGFEADGSPALRPAEIELAERAWRADPRDGLRPLVGMRERIAP